MKGKINLKTIIIFAILILGIILSVLGVKMAKTFMSGATADYEPQDTPIVIVSADARTAIISWTTDKAVVSSVLYGTNAASTPLMAIEETETTDHNISLSISPSVATYYYKIEAGGNTYDNGGMMFTFKNKVVTATPTIAPTMVPEMMEPVVTLPVGASSSAGTCNQKTDYNKDGVVNSLDYILCLKGKLTVTPTKAAGNP